MARKPMISPEERYANRRAAQESYRHRVRRFTLQFSLQDTEALEWFEIHPDKGSFLKELILADKRVHECNCMDNEQKTEEKATTEKKKKIKKQVPIR